MSRTPVRYAVIDAFTGVPFKGNPAAVCFLEEERDEAWMLSVAKEFNISETAFLVRLVAAESENPRFHLRWFTPVREVKLCGHATLAAAHFLFTSGFVSSYTIEFLTKSGLLTAKMVGSIESLAIELDFPSTIVTELGPQEYPLIPKTLNGVPMVNVLGAADDVILELPSAKDVADLQPQFDELLNCSERGVVITAAAPPDSGFDFFTRFFCPKFGINEDPVCGSVHCALAPYWSKKLGKHDLRAYMASPRGGTLDLHLDEVSKRVLIQGQAVTVMEGSLLF